MSERIGAIATGIATVSITIGSLVFLTSREGFSAESPDVPPTATVEPAPPTPTSLSIFMPRIIDCEFDENKWRYIELKEGRVNDLGTPTPTCMEWPAGFIHPVQ